MDNRSSIEQEEQEFYAAIGEAVTTWAFLEGRLFELYAYLLETNDIQLASASFFSIINFNSKLAMVDAIAFHKLEIDDDILEWNALRNRISRAAKRRNAMAHLSVHIRRNSPKGKRYCLAPSWFDMREDSILEYFRNFHEPLYTAARIRALIKGFTLLSERLARFNGRFGESNGWLWPKGRVLTKDRRTRIQTLIAQKNAKP